VSERNLVASALKSRKAFDALAPLLEPEELSDQGKIVWEHIGAYYERDAEARSCDTELISNSIARSLTNEKHRSSFRSLVEGLAGTEISPENAVADHVAFKLGAAGNRLASALAAGKGPTDIGPLLEEYHKWAEATPEGPAREVFQGPGVAELVRSSYGEGSRISVAPDSLNQRVGGGLVRGHHLVVFARPEVGKTLVLINMISGFLKQNLRVLYVGNEDPLTDVALRVVSRLTGRTRYEILDNPDEADAIARTQGYDNLVLAGLSPGTPREIVGLVKEFKPDVLVVDQIRNLNMKEENYVVKLEKACTFVRTLGKKYKMLVVSATQAGDSASGKSILDMGDVDFSNTGVAATADVMVGIGMSADDDAAGRRVLSLCKNKPGANHEFFPVGVDCQLSKVRSMG
jgi:archaellum biogenesis ATPase FlaH